MSIQNVLACNYIVPTGIEISSEVVQIVPISKTLPKQVTNMRILVSLCGTEILRLITMDLCNIKIYNLNLLFIFQDSLKLIPFVLNRFCCAQFYAHKKKISKDIHIVTRNLIHRNPDLSLTADYKVCSRCHKLLTKELLPKQECKQISTCTTSINSSEDQPMENIFESEYKICKINTSFATLFDETPIKQRKKSKTPKYAKKRNKKEEFTEREAWSKQLLLLLKKKVSSARLKESDIHPFSQKTSAPTIPTYREKEEKKTIVGIEQLRPIKKHWLCSWNPPVPHHRMLS